MNSLPGFTVLETLSQDQDGVLLRATRAGKPVLVRVLGGNYRTTEELARLRYGFEVSDSVDSAAVVKVYGIERHDRGVMMVMEDFGGRPLRSLLAAGRLPLADALEIAAALSRAVGELHRHKVVHKNIEPANIFVNQPAAQVKLGNFDIASRLTREQPRALSINRLEGSLAYISPEQTGRMNRGVDYRTDLYSLGVTLYEMFTGQVPFLATDPITLVHSHIAIEPRAPHEVRPEIPVALSRIVLRLLAKNAEDRYQSAFGVTADLKECLTQLGATGRIADFPPGRFDVFANFQLPQKLYGRDRDKERLIRAFERVSRGATEMMLVAGYSGIGKSSLVNEIHRPILQERGYFASGKFDQLQNVPYGAFIQAFQDLVRQILTESEAQVQALREQLADAFGPNGAVVTDVIPEVALIVGPQPPVPPLGPSESQNRFNFVFQQFIGVFARREHPLALFLDDLQWADSASLNLIQLLLRDPGSRHLFLIGAYRDNEVIGAHPLVMAIDEIKKGHVAVGEIQLRPLDLGDITQLLSDTLGGADDKAVAQLASLVFKKTQGNPFFVNQFLSSLYERELLTFDPDTGRWRWSVDRIQAEGITDNVASLMADKIRRLPEATQRELRLAACIGNTFDLETLALVSERSPRDTAIELWGAVQEGLVLPVGEAYKYVPADGGAPGTVEQAIQYEFLHDRVQEAAYALIPEESRPTIHLRLGRLLLANIAPDRREARIFDIVNQLDRAVDLIRDPVERIELARLNLVAGKRAKDSTAFQTAARFLQTGVSLLPDGAWQSQYDLAFNLYKESAACDYMLGQFEQADGAFDRVLSEARTSHEKGELYGLKQALGASRGAWAEAGKAARDGLKLFGIDLPPDDQLKPLVGAEVGRLLTNLATHSVDDIINAPPATSPEDQVAAMLLATSVLYGTYYNPDLFQVVSLTLVNRSIEIGNCPGSSNGYITCGLLLAGGLDDYAKAYDLGRIGLAVSEKLDPKVLRASTHFGFGGYISPWRKPIRESYPHEEQAYVEGLESGALVVGGYGALTLVWMMLLGGEELGGLFEKANQLYLVQQRTRQPDIVNAIVMFQQKMLLLQKGTLDGAEERFQEAVLLDNLKNYYAMVAVHYILSLEVAFILGDFERAREMAAQAEPRLMATFGHISVALFHYYYALLATHFLDTATGEEKEKYSKVLEAMRPRLKLWADNGPDNFEQKHLLVEAEAARVAGLTQEATDLYDRAIEAASRHEMPQDLALANELAGKFHLARGKRTVARAYLLDAHFAYARWGATAKVVDLEKRYPDLLRSAMLGRAGSSSSDSLDLTAVMKATQAISGEIVLQELLRKLMSTILENAGAQRAVLILRDDSPLVVDLDRSGGGAGEVVLSTGPVEGRSDLSTAIVRYVERTRESVVLGDAVGAGAFRADAYVVRTNARSILCMPVIKQQKLVGILYLENLGVADVFTPQRRQVLDLLSAQAAISLENARLYDTLESRVRDKTSELRESNEELSSTLKRLKDTQKQLIMQEKLASLGALTSGIAHEIKNPLNLVNNFAELSGGLLDELLAEVDKQRARLDPDSVEYLGEVIGDLKQNVVKVNEHGKRADSIVRAMLEHSRTGVGEKREVDLNQVLAEYVNLAYQGMRAQNPSFNVAIESSYDPALRPLTLVPQDIGRVFLNLVSNACYAAFARRRELGTRFAPAVKVSTHDAGKRIEIRVRDNGAGIPLALREKIFNPFFTTKPPGEGTGLGLSISYEIMQGNGGSISFETEEGTFTEFVLTLPKDLDEAPRSQPSA